MVPAIAFVTVTRVAIVFVSDSPAHATILTRVSIFAGTLYMNINKLAPWASKTTWNLSHWSNGEYMILHYECPSSHIREDNNIMCEQMC